MSHGGNRNNPKTDYALHDVITGRQTEVAQQKRWWMKKLAGPDSRKYSRILFHLPPLENEMDKTRRDEFADLLSEDLPRAEIMQRMGINADAYKSHLRAVRNDLGYQAS